MGVFARLLRGSKATEEASTAETDSGTPTAETAAQEAAEAKGPDGAETEAGPTKSEATAETEAEVEVEEAVAPAAEDTTGSGESVEIPKQQSAEEAADSGTGEGART